MKILNNLKSNNQETEKKRESTLQVKMQLSLFIICVVCCIAMLPRWSFQQCNNLQNTEFVGNDIAGYASPASSAIECCNRCQQLATCQAYTFNCYSICSLKFAIGSNWRSSANSMIILLMLLLSYQIFYRIIETCHFH